MRREGRVQEKGQMHIIRIENELKGHIWEHRVKEIIIDKTFRTGPFLVFCILGLQRALCGHLRVHEEIFNNTTSICEPKSTNRHGPTVAEPERLLLQDEIVWWYIRGKFCTGLLPWRHYPWELHFDGWFISSSGSGKKKSVGHNIYVKPSPVAWIRRGYDLQNKSDWAECPLC